MGGRPAPSGACLARAGRAATRRGVLPAWRRAAVTRLRAAHTCSQRARRRRSSRALEQAEGARRSAGRGGWHGRQLRARAREGEDEKMSAPRVDLSTPRAHGRQVTFGRSSGARMAGRSRDMRCLGSPPVRGQTEGARAGAGSKKGGVFARWAAFSARGRAGKIPGAPPNTSILALVDAFRAGRCRAQAVEAQSGTHPGRVVSVSPTGPIGLQPQRRRCPASSSPTSSE